MNSILNKIISKNLQKTIDKRKQVWYYIVKEKKAHQNGEGAQAVRTLNRRSSVSAERLLFLRMIPKARFKLCIKCQLNATMFNLKIYQMRTANRLLCSEVASQCRISGFCVGNVCRKEASPVDTEFSISVKLSLAARSSAEVARCFRGTVF